MITARQDPSSADEPFTVVKDRGLSGGHSGLCFVKAQVHLFSADIADLVHQTGPAVERTFTFSLCPGAGSPPVIRLTLPTLTRPVNVCLVPATMTLVTGSMDTTYSGTGPGMPRPRRCPTV